MDRAQQVPEPGDASSLVVHKVLAAGDEQAQLGVELADTGQGAQVIARADLIGDYPGISRFALVFAPTGGSPGVLDHQARDVHDGKSGAGEHHLQQLGDATQFLDEGGDVARQVVHPSTQHRHRLTGLWIQAGGHRTTYFNGGYGRNQTAVLPIGMPFETYDRNSWREARQICIRWRKILQALALSRD